MADHLTEEEQIETIKQWLKDNLLTLFVPIIVAGLAYVGYGIWESNQNAKAASGSDAFRPIMAALENTNAPKIDDATAKTIVAQSQTLKDEYGDTLYDDLALLLKARVDVENTRLDEAATTLQQVVQSGANDGVKAVAKARLAKVFIEQKKFDEALALVSVVENASFKGTFTEIRGDIALAQGDRATANSQYKAALESLGPLDFQRRGILELKEKSTATSSVKASDADAEPENA